MEEQIGCIIIPNKHQNAPCWSTCSYVLCLDAFASACLLFFKKRFRSFGYSGATASWASKAVAFSYQENEKQFKFYWSIL